MAPYVRFLLLFPLVTALIFAASVHSIEYQNTPMRFEANRGQADAEVQFLARGKGYTLFLTKSEAVLCAAGGAIRMWPAGAARNARLRALDRLSTRVTYFAASRRTAVPTFARVKYESVYRGIDLIYYGREGNLEYDFVVAPGTDARKIRLRYAGAQQAWVDTAGDLILETNGLKVRLHKPVAYQERAGHKQIVTANYVAPSAGEAHFAIGPYDSALPLIIDPVLSFSTLLGGNDYDEATAIAVDAAGSAYVTGRTSSLNFPTRNPVQARRTGAAVFKSTDAASTFSSSIAGLREQFVYSLAADPSGALFVGGTNGVARSSDGGANWSASSLTASIVTVAVDPVNSATVYAGGSTGVYRSTDSGQTWTRMISGMRQTTINSLAIDPLDPRTIYAGTEIGVYRSDNQAGAWTPVNTGLTNGSIQAIAIDPKTPATVYGATRAGLFRSTNSGGTWQSIALSRNLIRSIAIDPKTPATLYVGTSIGIYRSTDAGATFAQMNTGLGNPQVNAIAIDPGDTNTLYAGTSAGIYKSGDGGASWNATPQAASEVRTLLLDPQIASTLYAGTAAGYDIFVTKLSPSGNSIVYSTYIGGSADDVPRGIAIDSSGSAYVTGTTRSSDFPVTSGAFQTTYGLNADAFALKLDPGGSRLIYSTYLGGGSTDEGLSIAVDASGNAFVAGDSFSISFPTTDGAFQEDNFGDFDGFLVKLTSTGTDAVFSTYLGGSLEDDIQTVVVDGAGNAYVAGLTQSDDFPVTRGAFQSFHAGGDFDAFVTKVNPDGGIVYSTYLGGRGFDEATALAVDSAGNAYVVGGTDSLDFPVSRAAFQRSSAGFLDGFVFKLDANGANGIYSTYLGGEDNDAAFNVAVDSAGNAYVAGNTVSTKFPVTQDALRKATDVVDDGFLVKLNADASAAVFASYIGGSDIDSVNGLALDAAGNVYLAGSTFSSDLMTTAGAFQTSFGTLPEAFVMKIDLNAR